MGLDNDCKGIVMFSFLKRKIDYADVPLEEIKFSGEDLFILMGGLDTGGVALPTDALPWEELEHGDWGEAWRRQVVNRYASTGLVDEEGRPQGALADAVYPFAKMGMCITAFANPGSKDPCVEMSIYNGKASILKTAPGGAGFTIASAGPEEAWASAFAEAFDVCQRFVPAERSWHGDYLMEPGDKGMNALILSGDRDAARNMAARKGFDVAPLMRVIEQVETSRVVDAVKMEVFDMRGAEPTIVTMPSGSFVVPVPENEAAVRVRMKTLTVYPECGWICTETIAPREGLPADWRDNPEAYQYLSRFFSGDALAATDLFDVVTDVRDCPKELGGVPSGQPCRTE